jgi:hypothetical protein
MIPELMAAPVEVWTADLGDMSSDWALDIEAELVAVIGPTSPYELSETRSYFEWGASGANVEVLLTLAEWAFAGVAGNAAYDVVKRTVRSLADRAKERSGSTADAMTADEAVERGNWRLRAAFGITPDEAEKLEVVGQEQRADGSWVIRYELDDRRYEAEAVAADGFVWIARVGWKQRGSDDDD